MHPLKTESRPDMISDGDALLDAEGLQGLDEVQTEQGFESGRGSLSAQPKPR